MKAQGSLRFFRAFPSAFMCAAALWVAVGIELSPSASAQSGSCVPAVPCTDRRGCPDLVVDPGWLKDAFEEEAFFAETDCSVIEGEVQAGQRRLLRFTSNTPNLGPGALVIGSPQAHPEWFELDTCHGHPHFREYSDYRLWTPRGYSKWLTLRKKSGGACASDLLAANPQLAQQMVAGHKQGFCVVDLFPSDLPCNYPADPLKFVTCNYQGLGVCWADAYFYQLPGQWIDITGLPSGDYILEVEVNAEYFFQEADYTNNAAAIPVRIP